MARETTIGTGCQVGSGRGNGCGGYLDQQRRTGTWSGKCHRATRLVALGSSELMDADDVGLFQLIFIQQRFDQQSLGIYLVRHLDVVVFTMTRCN